MANKLHHELNDTLSFKGKALHSLREVVFGIEDGIVSTLGALTGIAIGTNSTYVVILSGFVIIFVESLSMAAGTFLSSKSEREMHEHMLREEEQEIEEQPEVERQELVDFYTTRGFAPNEIELIVNRVTSNKKLWLEEMAFKELKIIPEDTTTPKTDAAFMGVSYIFGGIIPLASYFFLPIRFAVPISVILSIALIFFVGYTKGRLVQINRWRSGLEMTLVSFSAAVVGYVIGAVVSHYFGV